MLSLISMRVTACALLLIPAVMFYPYAKRFLSLPSVVLGVILAYGVPLGYAAIYPEPLGLVSGQPASRRAALLCVSAAYTLFVSSIDMIYAHQDLKDDLKADIKSMAVTFQRHPKRALRRDGRHAVLPHGGQRVADGVRNLVLRLRCCGQRHLERADDLARRPAGQQ